MRNTIIIGGGLAGLISAIQLVRGGIPCTVVEKKSYPFHRVCGEYISNEALPFLKRSGLFPKDLDLPLIKTFEFSSVKGRSCKLALDLGGFGISRYTFDHFLYQVALKEGVGFELNNEATAITFQEGRFYVQTRFGQLTSDLVIGAFGKRSKIDVQQKREFLKKRSPYVGVKYHIRSDQPSDLISLHNFPGGYCGICNVEEGITNLCYLSHRDNIRRHGDIQEMESAVLYQNPFLRNIFRHSTFIFSKPEVINEISFETKGPVENHILMAGDAAGMITPVCGNGMAIAMHSGKILSDLAIQYCTDKISREMLEHRYRIAWNSQFKSRLWFGRQLQRLFGSPGFSNVTVDLARYSKPLANLLVGRSHGQPF